MGAVRDILVPESRTNVSLYSFRSEGAKLWNSIPSSIKFLASFGRYKATMRRRFEENL